MNPVALQGKVLDGYFMVCGLQFRRLAIDSETTMACWVPNRPSTAGQKPVVVLLHGFGASGKWSWGAQVRPLLLAGYDVYIPDLVFFGESWSSSKQRSSFFQAECIVKLMDFLGVCTFAVNGMSYGGIVAYRIATMRPDRVTGLAVTNSGVLMTPPDLQRMLARLEISSPEELLLPTDTKGIERVFHVSHHRPRIPPTWILHYFLTELFTSNLEEKRQMISSLLQELHERPEDSAVPRMKMLILWGRHDVIFPLAVAERMQRHFRARLLVLEDASHMSNDDQPALYNAAFLQFLRECIPGSVASQLDACKQHAEPLVGRTTASLNHRQPLEPTTFSGFAQNRGLSLQRALPVFLAFVWSILGLLLSALWLPA